MSTKLKLGDSVTSLKTFTPGTYKGDGIFVILAKDGSRQVVDRHVFYTYPAYGYDFIIERDKYLAKHSDEDVIWWGGGVLLSGSYTDHPIGNFIPDPKVSLSYLPYPNPSGLLLHATPASMVPVNPIPDAVKLRNIIGEIMHSVDLAWGSRTLEGKKENIIKQVFGMVTNADRAIAAWLRQSPGTTGTGKGAMWKAGVSWLQEKGYVDNVMKPFLSGNPETFLRRFARIVDIQALALLHSQGKIPQLNDDLSIGNTTYTLLSGSPTAIEIVKMHKRFAERALMILDDWDSNPGGS